MRRSIPILWGVVITLLLLNLALLYGLNRVRRSVIETLDTVEITLDNLTKEVIVYNIEVNQAVPIKADVPLNQTMEIPINTVIPIDQVLTVPFQTGSGEIEVDMPVKADFPIDMVVPVDFNETISVDTVVQLDTTVPVEIDIARTSLAGYLQQARLDVAQLRSRLSLQSEAIAMEETIAAASPEDDVMAGFTPPSTNDSSQVVSVELEPTAAPSQEVVKELDTSSISPPASVDVATQPHNEAIQPGLGWCDHAYWPLRPGTLWTYNSSHTSYNQRVDNVLNNQVQMSTQYEGQDIQFSLVCYQEGLGGSYLGDMRRITEFGDLNFSNPHGMFLPRPELMEKIGSSWTLEFDVTGTVEGQYDNRLVVGNVSLGRAVAVHTPTGFETLDTPLGPREALRIEQKLDLELDINFEINNHQIVPVTEIVNLTTIFWFVKGIGPVRIHWQGGTIQQDIAFGEININKRPSLAALPEEGLVSVCVLLEGNSSDCMQVTAISQSDLTVPPEPELEIQGIVLPSDAVFPRDANTDTDESVSITEIVDPNEPPEESAVENELPNEPAEDDNGLASLLAYAEAVANLGEKINDAAETFGKSAIAYRNGEITIDAFQDKFLSFASTVKGFIQEIGLLSPPPEAETIHQKLTSGLDQCDEAIDLMDGWFETQDSGTKDATALLVASCIDQVTAAGDELQALVNEN